MIQTLDIKNLFGRFNYSITTKQTGITLLTGPNGFGKSTILKIIEALYKGNIFYFFKLDFVEISITFTNNKTVQLKKISDKETEKILTINSIPITFRKDFDDYIALRSSLFLRTTNKWWSVRTRQEVSKEEVYNSFFKEMSAEDFDYLKLVKKESVEKILGIVENIMKWTGEVRLIAEQRLLKKRKEHERSEFDEEYNEEVISELPKMLIEKIKTVLAEYSNVSNQLDSSYTDRLLTSKDKITEKEYKEYYQEVKAKFEKLKKYNLVKMQIITEGNYSSEFSTALKVYFDDFATKYKVFESLIAKLEIFENIINARFTFKYLNISQENGFTIFDSGNPKKVIRIEELSSGEKQELILFYELIFNSKSDLLLLIDEPEISLHIAWQRHFLNDLMAVADIINLQAIVATHAPQIIDVHSDLQIDLGALYKNATNK